jgi:ABC-type glucose/galactose transport system permease subunit
VDAGVGLSDLFRLAAIAAVVMGGLSFALACGSQAAVAAPSPGQERQA